MSNKNIVLIGLMGSGKSSIARDLAQRLKRPLFCMDEIIEKEEGMPITQIFKDKGEDYFRQCEAQLVLRLSKEQNAVIDCGGGVVLHADNLRHLKRNAIIFFLNASPETIWERIKDDQKRPLVNVPNPLGRLREIYQQRLPLYNQADFIVDTNAASLEGPVVEIIGKITP